MKVRMVYLDRNTMLVSFIGIVALALVSFLIGYFSSSRTEIIDDNDYSFAFSNDEDSNLVDIVKQMSSDYMRDHLKYLTSIPHLAGTSGDKRSADYVYDQWKSQGLDNVQMVDYDVLLDYPDEIKYNSIEIRSSDEKLEELIEIKEKAYEPDADLRNISKPYLGFAMKGSVTSEEMYYGNYCVVDDFELLIKEGFNLTNKIVLCRYGFTFRGNKVKNAEKYGVAGVLLYDDPIRAAPLEARDKIYPNGDFLPPEGVQRGSLNYKEGDPSTPVYPSTNTAYRSNENQAKVLPKIPAQVIGYGLANQLMNLIDNKEKIVPEKWQGAMDTVYSFGGKFKENKKITLNVYNERKISKIFNVIGMIRGLLEPDRYVMIGNHRDAWTWGAVDPNSGTSVMLEVSRVLMNLKKSNLWRPKRTILFLSWDAEEFGVIGSTEWVEEFQKKLSANGVVYINIDNVIKGNYSLQIKASPLAFDVLYNVSRRVYVDENTTLFDRWLENEPNQNGNLPKINPYMGSGTDHVSFLQKAGISCIDQRIIRSSKDKLYSNIVGSYPLYHSSYDTFYMVNTFMDPGFKMRRIFGIFTAEVLHELSTALVLPFNVVTYANELQNEYVKFTNKFKATLDELNISLSYLKVSLDKFSLVASEFKSRLDSVDRKNFFEVRQYNEQMRNLERAFLDASTLMKNGYMHTIYAPSGFDKYSAMGFPVLSDSIQECLQSNKSEEKIDFVKFNLSVLIYSIDSASSILKDPLDFER